MPNSISNAEVVGYYDNQPLRDRSNARLDRIMQALGRLVKPGMTVLDVGCGSGITSRFMASRGANVMAIDISPVQVAFARRCLSHPDITYCVGDITEMEFATKFQLIVMADVFEHLNRESINFCLKRLLTNNTHTKSKVYLNVPDYYFMRLMLDKYPDKAQIIDEAISMGEILTLFAYWRFVPIHMQIYGIDTEKQYNEYIFANLDYLNKHYGDKMKAFWGDSKKEKYNA